MLTGVNIEATVALARAVSIPILASGGIADIGDIERLCAVAADGIAGAILGRALYEGQLDFKLALARAEALSQD
jgi:phosphoribosylformimino-5-aminoimidazole carboxamide ribotide isomerase